MQSLKSWITTASSKKINDFIAAVLTVLIVSLLFRSYTSFIYSTNDDLFIKSIVSGEVTGKPEFRGIYLGVLVGFIISRLYLLIPTLPWYGLFLCLCQMLAMLVVLYQCLRHTEKKGNKIIVLLLFCLISSGIQIQHFAFIQYTVVAAIVGAASIFSFIITEEREEPLQFFKANLPSFLLFILSLSIREKATLMLMPIAGMLWLFKWLNGPKPFSRKRIMAYFGYMGIILVLLAGIKVVDRAAYSQESWQKFLDYTRAREQITDYYGYPDYEKYKDLYEQYGISYESYIGAAEHYQILIDENINAEFMQAIATVAREDSRENFSLQSRIKETIINFINRNLDYSDRPLNLFVYTAYAIITLLALIGRKYRALLCEAFLLTGRMVSWFYLIWNGRYPERVTQGLYFGELLSLLAIGLFFQLFSTKKKMALVISIGLFGILTICCGMKKAAKVQGAVEGRLFTSTAYNQLKEYCASHPDHLYLLDMHSVEYYTEDIFDNQEYRYLNFMTLGSWLPKSPLYTEKLHNIGITNLEEAILESSEIFFVFKDDEGIEPDYLYQYFSMKYPQRSFHIADIFKADNGDTFFILQLVQLQ